MKHVILLGSLLAIALSACHKLDETPPPAVGSVTPDQATPVSPAPAEAVAPEAAAPAPAAEATPDAAAPAEPAMAAAPATTPAEPAMAAPDAAAPAAPATAAAPAATPAEPAMAAPDAASPAESATAAAPAAATEEPAATAAAPDAAAPAAAAGGAVLSVEDGSALAKKSGCFACHNIQQKRVGPAWNDVAAKYKGDPGAHDNLVKWIHTGGTGRWADPKTGKEMGVMPPYSPRVSDADIDSLANFILSLPRDS